jgi:hypothetical protein
MLNFSAFVPGSGLVELTWMGLRRVGFMMWMGLLRSEKVGVPKKRLVIWIHHDACILMTSWKFVCLLETQIPYVTMTMVLCCRWCDHVASMLVWCYKIDDFMWIVAYMRIYKNIVRVENMMQWAGSRYIPCKALFGIIVFLGITGDNPHMDRVKPISSPNPFKFPFCHNPKSTREG